MLLQDLFAYHARERPSADALRCDTTDFSYAALESVANRFARAVLAAGVRPGERIAILSRNRAEVVIAYLGAAKAGVVLVPLGFRLAPPEWAFILEDCEARLLIAADDLAEAVAPAAAALPRIETRVAIDATASTTPGG